MTAFRIVLSFLLLTTLSTLAQPVAITVAADKIIAPIGANERFVNIHKDK